MDRMKRMTLAAGAAAASLIALSGCAGGAAVGSSPAPTPTVTVTSTVTATPEPAVASPDDPLDALSVWTACAVLAHEVYGKDQPNETMLPYNPAHPPTKNADGTWEATVAYPINPPVEGAGSVIIICDLSGTKGAPKLIRWTGKDI